MEYPRAAAWRDPIGSTRMRAMTFRLAWSLLFVALVLSLSAGCGESEPLTLATYNGGLALAFVPYAEERAPRIFAEIPNVDFDALCVQEFWEQRHWDALAGAVSASHPYTHRRPNEMDMGSTASCTPSDLDELDTCVRAMCPGATPDTLVDCALMNCRDELGAVPDDCLTCLYANIALGDLDMIRAACEMPGGSAYTYDSSFGTGILSRYPLADVDSLLLESTTIRRSVLYARIPDTPQGEVHFFCTHLTSNLESVPYTGDHGDWIQEQAMQIQALITYANGKTGGTGQWVLAGDLNNGPALDGITAELPDNYAMWSGAGLRNLYASQAGAVCTYCDANPLNLGTMGGDGGLIDHVLVSDAVADGTARRFLDGPITVDVGGVSTDTAYSDHYGLALTIGE